MARTDRNHKKTKRAKNPKSSQIDRVVGKLSTALHFKGDQALLGVYDFKHKSSGEQLFQLFPRVFRSQNSLEFIHGPAFPTNPSNLFSKPALLKSADTLSEVIWAICRCLQFGDELKIFAQLRNEFERLLLSDAKTETENILKEVRSRFGYSVWLIQNELATMQHWDGIEGARKLTQEYRDECKDNWLMSWIIWFIGRRTEATGLKGHLKNEFSRIIESQDVGPEIESYLRAKIFELPQILTKDVASTLFLESQSCVIDYYETLILILQSAARFEAIPAEMLPSIKKPLVALLKVTGDRRLHSVMRGVGLIPQIDSEEDISRASLIESYTKGEYDSVIREAEKYLSKSPGDMAIQVLRLKSCMQKNEQQPYKGGVLKDSLESLQVVLEMSENTYAAAFNIVTLSERFYCHEWAKYLVAVVLHELRDEQSVYPSPELRHIFVLDPYTSPFSAVAANGEAKEAILKDVRLTELFPFTHAIYEAVTTGEINSSLPISKTRQEKYLAMHCMTTEAYGDAISHFRWLIENAPNNERLRAGSGIALALMKSNRLEEAIDAVVSTYADHPYVANILPVKEIVAALDDPEGWPDSISVAILFEIYTTYYDESKLANLRYAFEKFQNSHQIIEPSEIAQLIPKYGQQKIVLYLDSVWIPKVMRQTILYDGTKGIEEARIKVCRVLASLDAENESEYLEEIKERVKQLEIAKVTTLIQQSKVYVDIEAIKKSLRSKLGDSYARYKSSLPSTTNTDLLLYKKISEAVSQMADREGISVPLVLSSLHGLEPDKRTESDAQFEALFYEVTNEFLRGAHGLNAYLSTRVRHGTLSNTLRKPVADERLITSREEASSNYVPNEYWKSYQDRANEKEEWAKILKALDDFSRDFDCVIDCIKDELLQIKIVRELNDEGENNNALFVYPSSNLERKYVQEQDRSFRSMDDFVDYCVDILWEKTDQNLLKVQEVLKGEIRDRLMRPFDELSALLNTVTAQGVNELINAVGRARTSTQNNLNLVISWFKRNEVYDRQDYPPDFPFHIALNMVTNTMSNASGWKGASVTLNPESVPMPGRTLDGLVYVYYVLLENAILRSGINEEDLKVNASISFVNGIFSAKFTNPVSTSKLTQEERDKLESLRVSLKSDEYSRRAQREGRSGLHKIWLTINSPFYREPRLDYSLLDDSTFIVELAFKLEGLEDGNIDN